MRAKILKAVAIIAMGTCSLTALAPSPAKAEPTNEVKGEFSGYCAYGLSKGMDVKTDCSTNWKDPSSGRTYCFSNAEAKSAWVADPRGNLGRAETAYHIAGMKAQAKLKAEEEKKKAIADATAAQEMAQKAQNDAAAALDNSQKALDDAKRTLQAVPSATTPVTPPTSGKK